MADRPGDPGPPIEKELALPRWIMVMVVLLGVVTVALVGAAVAISTSGGPDEPRASASTPTPSATPTPSPTPSTPLANVECDGSFIVELGRSDPPYEKSDVEKLVTDTEGAKYLQADQSCSTYAPAGNRLIAYLGPFDDLPAACAKRVESGNIRAVPHHMEARQRGRNYCACEVDLPVLRVNDGEDNDPTTLMAVNEAQTMLKALGYFDPAVVVGNPYGPQSSAATQNLQANVGLPVTGVLNRATWAALRRSTAPGGPPLC
jgi:hypothetical protein